MGSVLNACYVILSMPITVEGFTFTLWQLSVFLGCMYLVVRLVYGIFR